MMDVYVVRRGPAEGAAQVIGLHGWGGDHRTFDPILPWRPEGSVLLAPDLPGYGASPAPARWTLEEVAHRTAEALRAEGVAPDAVWIGSCSGAIVALEVARQAPELVGRLILVDAFAWMPWYFRIFTWPVIGPVAYGSAFANPLGRWLGNRALSRRRAEGTDLTASFRDRRPEATLCWLRMLRDVEGPQRFAEVRAPVVVAYGERTFAAVRASAPRWVATWPERARTCELAGAGHLPILESSEAIAGLLWPPEDPAVGPVPLP